MIAIAVVGAAFVVGMYVQLKYQRTITALFLSFMTVPAFLTASEYLLPYMGGGASFFPIALIFGSIYGAIAGCLGILVAVGILFIKTRNSGST